MLKRAGTAIILLILAGLMVSGGLLAISWWGAGPLDKTENIAVPEGATLRSVAARLEDQGAVRSRTRFLIMARLFGGKAVLKAGEYRIPAHASGAAILAQLQGGKTVPLLVTIPEGMPSIMVKERLMANPDLVGPVDVPAEGSVMPDSYAYERGESRAAMLKKMQAAMTSFLDEQWEMRDGTTPVKTREQALALASIVEKETAVASERPTVAGVYANRLRIGMRLQADPTIIYPLTKGKPLGRRILRSEREARNDYNTYSMAGLPKGPIANPGRDAIKAVLHPADTRAIYFVADGKGGHVFAETLAEHEANRRKWYAIRRQRGEM